MRGTASILVVFTMTLAVLSAGAAGAAAPETQRAADRTWSFVRNPIDRRQLTSVAFGERSHWAQPWRAYLETVPGARFRNGVGINFNVDARHAEATARLLSRAGFRRARVEIGWGEHAFVHPDRLKRAGYYRRILLALADAGLRPLILLNGNHGEPCPTKFFDARVVASALEGDRSIHVDSATAAKITPGRTGLNGRAGSTKAAATLFTSVSNDGTVRLSRPLESDLTPGEYPAATLRYQPFQRPILADGTQNPAFEETLAGWLQYVDETVRFVRSVLGSARFDLEVWNEFSFGSDFLESDSYYEPPIDNATGDTTRAILDRTVAWLRDPERGLDQIGIGDGFASQTPFAAGSTSPRGLTALDKHPYANARRFPKDAIFDGVTPLNARGQSDGTAEQDVYRDRFVPRYTAFFPEYFLTAIQTESLVRDLSPFTTLVYDTPHGRGTHPRGGSPPSVWVTEWNLDPADGGFGPRAGPLTPPQRRIQAKSALRALLSFMNKGVGAVYLFGAEDERLGIITPDFFRRNGKGAYQVGQTIAAIRRLTSQLRGPATIHRPRSVSLVAVGDQARRVQFLGDGTAVHPPLRDREIVAFLPFQVSDTRLVVAVYVMTRNVVKSYAPTPYRFVIGGVQGCRVRVSASDPLTGHDTPISMRSCGRKLVVQVPLTDSPRLLTLDLSPRAKQ